MPIFEETWKTEIALLHEEAPNQNILVALYFKGHGCQVDDSLTYIGKQGPVKCNSPEKFLRDIAKIQNVFSFGFFDCCAPGTDSDEKGSALRGVNNFYAVYRQAGDCQECDCELTAESRSLCGSLFEHLQVFSAGDELDQGSLMLMLPERLPESLKLKVQQIGWTFQRNN